MTSETFIKILPVQRRRRRGEGGAEHEVISMLLLSMMTSTQMCDQHLKTLLETCIKISIFLIVQAFGEDQLLKRKNFSHFVL